MFRFNHPMTLGAAIAFWLLAAALQWSRGESLLNPSTIVGGVFVAVLVWGKFDPRVGRFLRPEKPPANPK